jgi:hypothetical protein
LISGCAAAPDCTGLAAATLSRAVYAASKAGGNMVRRAMRSAAIVDEIIRDVLLVSSFGFWAVLLGFVPVLAYHGFIGN